MPRNDVPSLPAVGDDSTRVRQLYPGFDQFERRHVGGLLASFALHFVVLMGIWWSRSAPQPPEPKLVEVEIIQAEPIKASGKTATVKLAKISKRESNRKQKPPKSHVQPRMKPVPLEAREYDMAAQVVTASGGKSRKHSGKVALPDVSHPVTMSGREVLTPAAISRAPEQAQVSSLQAAEQRGTLKPRLSSIGQQASSRMQLPSQAGVESENGPKLIASSAPSSQTLAPEYRQSSRPGGAYSSQGGAAQPAMGGGPSSEASQAYSLQSSSYAGSPAGNPAASSYNTGGVPQGRAGRTSGLMSGPVSAGVSRSGEAAPTEIHSSGGQNQVASNGVPINPLKINSSGGTTGGKATVAAGSTGVGGGDATEPGYGSSGSGMVESGDGGRLASSSGSRGSIGGSGKSMSASIVPEGSGVVTAGLGEDSIVARELQSEKAPGTARVIEERYAARELRVNSPKTLCELPLLLAGLDRKPLPEGLASIMGSESAMVMEAPPVLLPGNLLPSYPLAALGSRQQGKVIVRVQVLSDGRVGQAFIRDTSGSKPLDDAAVATVRGWRFQPARRNGQPVPAWVNVPIEYRNPS